MMNNKIRFNTNKATHVSHLDIYIYIKKYIHIYTISISEWNTCVALLVLNLIILLIIIIDVMLTFGTFQLNYMQL